MKWCWLFVGGGVGATLRFALAGWIQSRAGADFPWGTFVVNAVGCFAIGVLATLLEERSIVGPTARIGLLVGLLGGFTTFSTFGIETWRLLEASEWGLVVGNVVGSVGVGLAAVAVGIAAGRAVS